MNQELTTTVLPVPVHARRRVCALRIPAAMLRVRYLWRRDSRLSGTSLRVQYLWQLMSIRVLQIAHVSTLPVVVVELRARVLWWHSRLAMVYRHGCRLQFCVVEFVLFPTTI